MKMPLDNWTDVKRGQYTFGVPTFYSDFHLGTDYLTPVGKNIYAPEAGFVHTMNGKQGGKTIHLKTLSGKLIRFLHLSEFVVISGFVHAGTLIGKTGNTGLSTGPHVHIDVSYDTLKLWDTDNFIDPEKYFMNKQITIKFIVVGKERIEDKVLEVLQWYKDKSNNEITFRADIEYIDEVTQIDWTGDVISNHWRNMHIAARAGGYDMAVLCLPPELWETNRFWGFASGSKHLGVQVIWMEMDLKRKDRRSRGIADNNQFAATLRHEISHSLHTMQGWKYNGEDDEFQHGKDNTHYLDYTAKNLEKMFEYIDRDKIKGWNENRMFRYRLPWTRTKKFTGNPKQLKIYRTTDGRMFFHYTSKWNIITEEEYNEYGQAGRQKGIMSVAEGNWIYKQLGAELPPPNRDNIIERVAHNKALETWLKLQGFTYEIPTKHL